MINNNGLRSAGRLGRPRALAVAMVLVGVGYAVVHPLPMGTSQPGWVWATTARNPAMEHVLYAVSITLGLFLIAWARNPERALPLIDWVIVANLVHGTVMLVHALTMPHGHDHLTLTGDVVGTYSGPLLLLACHPRLLRRGMVTTPPQDAPGRHGSGGPGVTVAS